jgi:hypothetical protein
LPFDDYADHHLVSKAGVMFFVLGDGLAGGVEGAGGGNLVDAVTAGRMGDENGRGVFP